MNYATIRVSGSCATVVGFRDIPTGTVGGTITIEYADPAWNSLVKTGVFRGCCTRDVLNIGSIVEIPHEVVAHPGRLTFGIWGYDPNTGNVTPTFWAELGRIRPGADPSGDESANPTPPVWAQLQSMIGDLNQLDTATKENLVAAINEALTKGGGAVDEETVQRIVQEYLESNPPTGGQDGITPHIGDNGNWYIGDTDTGAPSRGERGETGEVGPAGPQGKDGATGPAGRDGEDGKSAYQYAIESGYTATEKQFSKDLSLVGTLSENDVRSYGVLPGTDCSEALQEAVKDGGEFYFPAGRYEFYNVEITKDTVFRLHPDAEFHSEKSTRMIKAFECSFSMYGGKVSSGTEYPDRANTPYLHESRVRIASEYYGIIVLYGCHDCVIEGVNVPYSSHSSVFMVYGDHSGEDGKDRSINVKVGGEYRNPARSKNIAFRNCSFNNFLLSAIAVRYGNDNILIEDCSFKDALRENRMDADGNLVLVDYAYCVVTGVSNVSTVDYDDGTPGDAYIGYTPTNGYVVRNCYVKNCEGTAIDSHGASNVIYEGNTLIDCDSFITAYWDYKRVKTGEGWAMENITVRNNWCRTTRAFDYAANIHPHPPIMLYSQGPLGMMHNVIVENNHIDTNWQYFDSYNDDRYRDIICIFFVDNIIFRNNIIRAYSDTVRVSALQSCRNVDVDNMVLIGNFNQAFWLETSLCRMGKFDCTRATFADAMFSAKESYYSVVDTDNLTVMGVVDNMFSGWRSVMNRYGKPLQEVEGILPLNGDISTYKGFVGKNLTVQVTIVSRTANTVTTGSCRFLPGTRVIVGEGAYYIKSVESNAERNRYTYTLDKNLGASGQTATYISNSIPYTSQYTAAAAE